MLWFKCQKNIYKLVQIRKLYHIIYFIIFQCTQTVLPVCRFYKQTIWTYVLISYLLFFNTFVKLSPVISILSAYPQTKSINNSEQEIKQWGEWDLKRARATLLVVVAVFKKIWKGNMMCYRTILTKWMVI